MSDSTSLGVFIATTNGPVGIQRITEEDPDIDSVVCLAGKAMPLPISNAYQDFVRQPSGVIQREFGHGSYRVDLSATIEDGYSWQLGLYLAHAAAAAQSLESSDNAQNTVIFATGEVNIDLNVLAVDHVPAKLTRLKAPAQALAAAGAHVVIIVPQENMDDVPTEWAATDIEVRGAATIDDALLAAGLTETRPQDTVLPAAISKKDSPPRTGGTARSVLVALGGLFAVGGLASYTLDPSLVKRWIPLDLSIQKPAQPRTLDKAAPPPSSAQKSNTENAPTTAAAKAEKPLPAAPTPPAQSVRIKLIEYRAPSGKSCAAVRFGVAEPVVKEVAVRSGRAFETIRFPGLCRLEFAASAKSKSAYLWGRLARWPHGRDEISETLTRGPRNGELRWRIELPRELLRDFDMHVLVTAHPQPVDGTTASIVQHLPDIHPKNLLAGWQERVRALAAKGVVLRDMSLALVR